MFLIRPIKHNMAKYYLLSAKYIKLQKFDLGGVYEYNIRAHIVI